MRLRTKFALLAALVSALALAAAAQATNFAAWGGAQKIDEIAGNNSELNTPFQDGCPIQSPDGLSLYIASTRPGGVGLLDIWVARRDSKGDPWGAPENLGEPINSAADEFCPTPVQGGGLFFVSREALPGSCGWETSTSRATTRLTGGRSHATWAAPRAGRTPRSTSRARRTSRTTTTLTCSSHRARRWFRATST